MSKRLNPYEGYRRSAMLSHVFGYVVANELRIKADELCNGDIETLVKTKMYKLDKYVPIEKVRLYFSLDNVDSFEENVPEQARQLALLKANELYTLYLEGMKELDS